ncbi:hypothetical protein BAE44_0025469 [Dichanthelium oligosanthes]|uniref:Uncharacterized protein n=1 Tax=Dichanthelium oligosanthes TaxID=888268 RepID=A0A1E5UKV5_9POAL|nr:hypothetical protein BAE44_0025469 [Dichanthelium oligosanthes]
MAAASSSSSSLSLSALLRHRLRATVRCCFGNGNGVGGLGERMRWRSRAGVEEFRYDPLSYALNFDDGDLLGVDGEEGRGDRFLCRSLSSRLLAPTPHAAVEIA